jgi:hypothetical protein
MQRRRRPFYIIGHNPNTIEEVQEFLELGANGLEPDIVCSEGQFYVSHFQLPTYEGIPKLEDYLHDLKQLLITKQYNLALIIFDMKETGFDPNDLIAVIKNNFSGGPCDGVAIVMSHGDDTNFVTRYKGTYPNVGVGVDESNTPPSELEMIFRQSGQKNFTYADGITTFLTKPGVFKNTSAALTCRFLNEPDSFSFVYTWVLSNESSMRKYLDSYIDGIFVDTPGVKRLIELVRSSPYEDVYQIAQNGHNPFNLQPIPKYRLTIRTMDRHLAGTDADILFTLTGSNGELKSLPFNSGLLGALERNSTSYVMIEGADIGEIKSLSVEMLSSDFNSDWLPEYILVESKLLAEPVRFTFNMEGMPESWITRKGGIVKRFAV